ncbi:signal peptidase II [Candidatus Woesearchaeota archaeon]|nr:signal peptidase II [Candidatus Woesearchaeota archaeon]
MSPKKKNISTNTEKIKFLIIVLTSSAVVIFDQIVKFIIVRNIPLGISIPLVPRMLSLTYIQNTGAGFGLLQGNTRLLIWFSIIVIGIILYFYEAIPENKTVQFSIALILGGTFGNLIDRINLGYVIDFFDLSIWPAFNIADAAITAGAVLLIIYTINKK